MSAEPRDPRIDHILELVTTLAAGDLTARLSPGPDGDELDGIMVGLSMLAEELEASVGELRRSQDELERRVAERTEELAEKTGILESILDNMSDGVVAVDEQRRFLVFNTAARMFVGETQQVEGAADLNAVTRGLYLPDGVTPFPPERLPTLRALRGEITDGVEMLVRNAERPEGVVLAVSGRPLRDAAGRVRGGIAVARDMTALKRTEAEMLQANSRLAALLEEEARHSEEFRLLGEMSGFLQAADTIDELCEVISTYLGRLFPESVGGFYLYSPSRDDLELRAAWGAFPEQEQDKVLRPSDCWGLRRGRPHAVPATGTHLPSRHVPVMPPGGFLCVPVSGVDETIGLLHARFAASPRGTETEAREVWQERERLGVNACELFGLAVVNLRLREALRQQSIRDPVTGLFNRRYLLETFEREVHRAARAVSPLCVFMLDLDRLKSFNDTHGHAAGDLALRSVGLLLAESVRGGDVAARFGGDEFVLVLPDTGMEEGRRRAAEIGARVRGVRLSDAGTDLGSVTVSVGMAAFPEHGETPAVLLEAADRALYAAKADGRDCVKVAAAV